MESVARKKMKNSKGVVQQRKNSLPPMNADALALREKIRQRHVTKSDIERALAALRATAIQYRNEN
jgi:hypothetical protein